MVILYNNPRGIFHVRKEYGVLVWNIVVTRMIRIKMGNYIYIIYCKVFFFFFFFFLICLYSLRESKKHFKNT